MQISSARVYSDLIFLLLIALLNETTPGIPCYYNEQYIYIVEDCYDLLIGNILESCRGPSQLIILDFRELCPQSALLCKKGRALWCLN